MKQGAVGWNREALPAVRPVVVADAVNSATLRLFGRLDNTSAASAGFTVLDAANTTWTETGLTWNNRPPPGTTVRGTGTVTGTAGKWYEVDLTAFLPGGEGGRAEPRHAGDHGHGGQPVDHPVRQRRGRRRHAAAVGRRIRRAASGVDRLAVGQRAAHLSDRDRFRPRSGAAMQELHGEPDAFRRVEPGRHPRVTRAADLLPRFAVPRWRPDVLVFCERSRVRSPLWRIPMLLPLSRGVLRRITNRGFSRSGHRSASRPRAITSQLESLEDRRLFAAGDLDPSFSGDGVAQVGNLSVASRAAIGTLGLPGNKTLVVGTATGGSGALGRRRVRRPLQRRRLARHVVLLRRTADVRLRRRRRRRGRPRRPPLRRQGRHRRPRR